MIHVVRSFVVVLLMVSTLSVQAADCQKADELVREAYNLGDQPENYAQQRRLFDKALTLCPDHPQAHNNLGWIAEQQGRFDDALRHYQRSVQANPQGANAQAGLGRMYERQRQFPLALEAYLHACEQKPEVRERIAHLLEKNRYQVAADNTILNKESLLLLFDRARREELNRLLEQCRFRSGDDFGDRGVDVEAAVDFPNMLFDLGKATLKTESLRQIQAIGAALTAFSDVRVIVNGHTDMTPFAGVTDPEENLRLNLRLSEERADVVAGELAELGVPRYIIESRGFGPTRPAIQADTEEARAANRRVEIVVK